MKQLTLVETSNPKPNLSSSHGGKTVVVTPQEKERRLSATPTSQELAKDPDPSTAIVPKKLDFSYPAILSKVYTYPIYWQNQSLTPPLVTRDH